MSGLLFEKPLAIVDVETTGSSPNRCRILEIAVIRIEKGIITEKFTTILDPECSIPESITTLTGISAHHIKAAPTFNDKIEDIERLLAGAIFVAHNVQFDYAFIKSEFKRLGRKFSAKRLCTVKLSRKLFPGYKHHDLSSVIDRYNLKCEARHRALGDAEVLAEFLKRAHTLVGEKKYRIVVDSIISERNVPTMISPHIIDSLPESPGVYIFYGEHGEKLYIGKSINIKKRVLSHFIQDGSSKSVRLAQEVRDIEAIETHGELGALLLESELIKQEQPLYNRLLRHARKLVVAEEYEDEAGYKRVELKECSANKEEFSNYSEQYSEKTLGIFKSLSQAKKVLQEYANTYNLCQVLLSLEKTKTCFSSQIGKCKGACSKKEDPLLYNMRFDEAFAERRIKAWPYSGAVIIEEKKEELNTHEGTVFIIDDWKLVRSFTYDEEGNEREFLGHSIHHFNRDTYAILARYIVDNPRNVKPMM